MRDLIIPSKRNNYNPFFSTRVAMVILTIWVLLANSFSGILIESFGVYATNMNSSRIIQLTNEERAKRGLNPLKSDANLASAAHAKANDMFEKQYWDHFGPNGESPWDFIRSSGYEYVYAGENLGKGFTTSEGVHQAWMASPTHRDNIISANYEDIGVAIVSGELHGEKLILVVQMFGNRSRPPTTESPVVGQTVQEIEEVVQETRPTPAPTPAPAPQPQREPEYIQGDSEDGKTKSIRIVYPEEDVTYTDPQIPVKGETENFNMGETIEIVKDNSVLGETKVERDDVWEFRSSHDWKEGRNYIDAVISYDDEQYRDSVKFFIKSSPPEVLGIDVQQKDGKFYIVVDVEEDAQEVSLIMGSDIIEGDIVDGTSDFVVLEEELSETVFLVVTDKYGNFVQEDITDYFVEREIEGSFSIAGFINFNISSVQRFITVLLATFVLGILLVQVYFYNREDKLKEKSGDFLMVGIWWLVFLFGSFIGYSGTIY